MQYCKWVLSFVVYLCADYLQGLSGSSPGHPLVQLVSSNPGPDWCYDALATVGPPEPMAAPRSLSREPNYILPLNLHGSCDALSTFCCTLRTRFQIKSGWCCIAQWVAMFRKILLFSNISPSLFGLRIKMFENQKAIKKNERWTFCLFA